MNNHRILILGGYGNTGRPLARLLLEATDVRLVLAGRNVARAEATAAELNGRFGGDRVVGAYADASQLPSLHRAFEDVDVVVVTSSTAEFVENVANAALEARADYLDVQYSTQKMAVLQSMAGRIEESGCCFITDGGFHPGLPAALIHYVAPCFDRLEKAVVGSVMTTVEELVTEFTDFQALVFHEGNWQQIGMMGMMKPQTMDFGREFGRQYCVPMFLEEMRAIPELYPDILETGFYVGGFNWFVDWFASPIIMLALHLWPQRAITPTARLMHWGLRTFSRPPYGTLLKVEARGTRDGQAKAVDVTIYHEDGYAFTAIPVAACLLQYLDGSIRKPGLWLQAHIVEPNRLMRDMERLGIEVHTQATPENTTY
jgi:saccharopine dehydrogenase-like NADP-dependent oxidoreductase